MGSTPWIRLESDGETNFPSPLSGIIDPGGRPPALDDFGWHTYRDHVIPHRFRDNGSGTDYGVPADISKYDRGASDPRTLADADHGALTLLLADGTVCLPGSVRIATTRNLNPRGQEHVAFEMNET